MTTTTLFTPLETQTLIALYDDGPNWWMYFWRLSDRMLDDGDEDGCRFVKWLSGWQQRPSDKYANGEGWYWWTTDDDEMTKEWQARGPDFHNQCFMPLLFAPVCSGSHMARIVCGLDGDRLHHRTPVDALIAACDHWRTFTEEQKQVLESEWTQ